VSRRRKPNELEVRLRQLLFAQKANTPEDVRDPALRAEARFLAAEVERQRAALRAARAAQSRANGLRGLEKARASRHAARERKQVAAHQLFGLGWSQRKIARRLGVEKRHVWRLLHEYPLPGVPRCPQCSQILPDLTESPTEPQP
jgi:hypothetical protein